MCWEPQLVAQYTIEKDWTKYQVAKTWASLTYGVISFNGWGICTVNQQAIRIVIEDISTTNKLNKCTSFIMLINKVIKL